MRVRGFGEDGRRGYRERRERRGVRAGAVVTSSAEGGTER